MAAEAAVLGTPSLRASSFVGRISYLEELEHRYGLTFAFHPREDERFLAKLDDLRAFFVEGHGRMLADKENITEWFVERICSGQFARVGH